MSNRTTISLIKADVGSLVGHHVVPKPLLQIAEQLLQKAKEDKLINSFHFSTLETIFNSSWYMNTESQIKNIQAKLKDRFEPE